jgi:hypothetical protein
VNVTSRKPDSETRIVVAPGEHPFVIRESVAELFSGNRKVSPH